VTGYLLNMPGILKYLCICNATNRVLKALCNYCVISVNFRGDDHEMIKHIRNNKRDNTSINQECTVMVILTYNGT
jgi:hypothetical protein